MSLQSTVPLEPVNSCFRMGVEANAATLPDSSSNGYTCRSGSNFNPNDSHTVSFLHAQPVNDQFLPVSHLQSQSFRNRRRCERHRRHQLDKANRQRAHRRRMLWNQFQREQHIATLQAEEQHLGPQILVDAIPGQARIGSVNMEKSNPDKLENLVHLAAQRGWEITVVSECAPTSRNTRLQPGTGFRHWTWEQWEFVHAGQVGILLNPAWSQAWHCFNGKKHRSDSGRLCTLELPRDPALASSRGAASWLLTEVWAQVSTADVSVLDEFWDDVACATRVLPSHIPHVIAGDFNSQVFEDDDLNNRVSGNPVLGQYKPPNRHQLDTYVLEKILTLDGDWVHADSFRPTIGSRHRCTWFSAIHRKYYEIDWMLLARRHLRRLVSFTMRHVTAPLHHSTLLKNMCFDLSNRQFDRPLDLLFDPTCMCLEATPRLLPKPEPLCRQKFVPGCLPRSRMTGPTLFPYFARLLMMPL